MSEANDLARGDALPGLGELRDALRPGRLDKCVHVVVHHDYRPQSAPIGRSAQYDVEHDIPFIGREFGMRARNPPGEADGACSLPPVWDVSSI